MEKSEAAVLLADLLARAAESVPHPPASQAKLLAQLERLRERLATERFQLAVLGQFKRGKSTLLNALLRDSILPTGVVPVTAIPTFIQQAESPRLRVTHNGGRVEEDELADGEELRERLRRLVTEEGNPHNVLEVARVDVFLPSQLLERGVVLIDTPGVGSTHRHNTAAADAVLPECDATLFVVSPDPPITQVEIEYLARIRQTVAHLTIIVNKIDTLEPEERETAVAFLRRVLVEEARLNGATPLFCVSARGALRASGKRDQDALRASGFPEVEAHLMEFLAHEKHATLTAAISRKAWALVHELRLETEIALKSLRLPMQELEQRIGSFDEAAARFETQRQGAGDLLTGDRIRALEELQADAERLYHEGRATLERELDRALAGGVDSDAARALLAKTVVSFFDTALAKVVRTVGERIATIFSAHQERADELVSLVRQTAADLMEIPFRALASGDRFETRRDPFWVTSARTVTLSPIPPDAFDRLLPPSIRQRRLRRRLLDEIDSVLRRNVENLRWATRQNLEDAFRKFGAELDERLALSLVATRGAMKTALDRRLEHAGAVEEEIAEKQMAAKRLAEIADAIGNRR